MSAQKLLGLFILVIGIAGLSVSAPATARDLKDTDKNPWGKFDKNGWPVQSPSDPTDYQKCVILNPNPCGNTTCAANTTYVCPASPSVQWPYRYTVQQRSYGRCQDSEVQTENCSLYDPVYCAQNYAYKKNLSGTCFDPQCPFFTIDTVPGCIPSNQ